MNTCSNCGAAVRPGAKFCTACGTRLNDVSASVASPEWTSGRPAENAAGAPGSPDATGAPGENGTFAASDGTRVDLPARDVTTSSSTASTSGTSEEVSSWSWRSSPSETEAPATATDDAEDGTTVPSSEQSRVTIVETKDDAATPSSNAEPATDEFTWTWEPSPSSGNGPESERDAAGTISESDVAIEDTPRATKADAAVVNISDDQESSANPSDDSWSSAGTSRGDSVSGTGSNRVNVSWGSATDAGDDSGMTVESDTIQVQQPAAEASGAPEAGSAPGEPATESGSGSSEEDPLDRARRLIEELRTLIPTPHLYQEKIRQTFSAPAPGPATAELQSELESARSTSDFTDLRSALESARARPRDVDTMLELVGRIDRMLDALDDRDRLAAAVDRALDQLQHDAGAALLDRS
jgi:hypothetical protein